MILHVHAEYISDVNTIAGMVYVATVYIQIFEACKFRGCQIKHFHDFIFEDHQVYPTL